MILSKISLYILILSKNSIDSTLQIQNNNPNNICQRIKRTRDTAQNIILTEIPDGVETRRSQENKHLKKTHRTHTKKIWIKRDLNCFMVAHTKSSIINKITYLLICIRKNSLVICTMCETISSLCFVFVDSKW